MNNKVEILDYPKNNNASIRVKSDQEYVIEVNDKGETISFDLSDIGLTAKLIDILEKIEVVTKKYDNQVKEIRSREDVQINEFVSQNQKDETNLLQKYYEEARFLVDQFLGNNACQKIFGDKNYPNMFDVLFEQLTPEFEKMGLNFKNMQKKLIEKYRTKKNEGLK